MAIPIKKKLCKTCNQLSYIFSHGNCQSCATKAKMSLLQSDTIPAKPFKVKYHPNKTVEQIKHKADLNTFFEMQEVPDRCENCNLKLNAYNTWAKRCVTAHILPKNDNCFPEVSIHPLNIIFLGKGLFSDCSCHDNWDNNDDNYRKGMRVYKIALERYEQFKHLIPDNKIGKAEKYLGL